MTEQTAARTAGEPSLVRIPIAAELQAACAGLIADSRRSGANVGTLLNGFLARYLPWPFRANSGHLFDSTGAESPIFDSVIYTSSEEFSRVPADRVACAIDIQPNLDLQMFAASYERIASAKKLVKNPPPSTPGRPVADATMGIIFAVDSDVPLETIAEELDRLNQKHSHQHWVDMVVVLSRGTINYACQFPHKGLGTFLPPAREVTISVPMYVHIFAKAHSEFSLNKMCSILFSYLMLFSPGTVLPLHDEILRGIPSTGMTIAAYQANLRGELVPVPRELRFGQFFMFPLGFDVKAPNGDHLGKVEYLPWQEGGVVRVTGKMPIEGLLVFAGKEALAQPIIRFGGEQISGVIPLSRNQFIEMAKRAARQSNLTIKPHERPKWVVQKGGDEGTTSPFIARLFLGILGLRDQALTDKDEREEFDKAFEGIHTGITTIRAAAAKIVEMYSSHAARVARGEIARVAGGVLFVDENIDPELRKQTEIVISTAGRVVKDRMQEVLRSLKLDIGFFYRKPSTFARGIAKLKQQNGSLADYLDQSRIKWAERLSNCRNALEHEGWVLPHVVHFADRGSVRTTEPQVDSQPVTEFVAHIVDRTCCFVEEMCVHALQARMLEGLSVTEIPISHRRPEVVERFQPALIGGGMPIWDIKYHDTKFEKT